MHPGNQQRVLMEVLKKQMKEDQKWEKIEKMRKRKEMSKEEREAEIEKMKQERKESEKVEVKPNHLKVLCKKCAKHFHKIGACNAAVKNGHIECLRKAYDHYKIIDDETFTTAAQTNDEECLAFLYEHGCKFDGNTITELVKNDNNKMLGALLIRNPIVSDGSLNWAAAMGKIKVLEMLHGNSVKRGKRGNWSTITAMKAASGGHLECLQWLCEHGCPCDDTAFYGAAHGGHIKCLQYVWYRGCVQNKPHVLSYALKYAKEGKHMTCVYFIEKLISRSFFESVIQTEDSLQLMLQEEEEKEEEEKEEEEKEGLQSSSQSRLRTETETKKEEWGEEMEEN